MDARKLPKYVLIWPHVKEKSRPCSDSEFPTLATTLRCYIKLYTLSDRFNIAALKNFCFKNISQIIPQLVTKFNNVSSGPSHSDSEPGILLIKIVHYLADNIALLSDSLMEYLTKTIAFTLEPIRVLPEFTDLVNSHPGIAIAVCMSACPAMQPPDPWLSRNPPPIPLLPTPPPRRANRWREV